MKWKSLAYWVAVILLFSLMPVLSYVLRLGTEALSPDLRDWADFGEYLGGVLGPLLAFANIIVLLRLTYLVAKFDENNSRSSIQSQKMIALNHLQHSAYSKIADKLYSVNEILLDSTNPTQQLTLLYIDVLSFNKTMTHLFACLSDSNTHALLEDSILTLMGALQDGQDSVSAKQQTLELTKDAFAKLVRMRDGYLNELQNSMLREL